MVSDSEVVVEEKCEREDVKESESVRDKLDEMESVTAPVGDMVLDVETNAVTLSHTEAEELKRGV